MKINYVVLGIIILLLVCSCTKPEENSRPARQTQRASESDTAREIASDTNYVNFALNVHDWVFPEQSADAVLKTIEIHERYNVPVDIFVDDQVFQIYVEEYPEVIQKLKSSSVVTVCYHIRPPTPTYSHFDIFDLSTKTEDELYDILLEYEEHAINLETALPEEKAGGYEFVKDTIGYAPVTVSLLFNTDTEKKVMAQIYKEKGAKLGIIHGKTIKSRQTLYGMLLRPEDIEIKWYEQLYRYMNGLVTAESYLTSQIEQAGNGPGLFVNLKMHENNYYTSGTTFDPVYILNANRETPQDPPYDLSLGEKNAEYKTAEETEALWQWYEDGVAYVAEHPELYTAVGAEDIAEMV
jgi:hypothetical protein